ncbi:MAG: type VI secretion system baseplate subunit TssK, partial [Ilumatobacteraceae bacterium]
KRHHIGEVPAYDHLQPAPGFTTLFAMIGELVNTVISSKYLAIPLRHDASRPSHYEGGPRWGPAFVLRCWVETMRREGPQ